MKRFVFIFFILQIMLDLYCKYALAQDVNTGGTTFDKPIRCQTGYVKSKHLNVCIPRIGGGFCDGWAFPNYPGICLQQNPDRPITESMSGIKCIFSSLELSTFECTVTCPQEMKPSKLTYQRCIGPSACDGLLNIDTKVCVNQLPPTSTEPGKPIISCIISVGADRLSSLYQCRICDDPSKPIIGLSCNGCNKDEYINAVQLPLKCTKKKSFSKSSSGFLTEKLDYIIAKCKDDEIVVDYIYQTDEGQTIKQPQCFKFIQCDSQSSFSYEQKKCIPFNQCTGFVDEQRKCLPLQECKGFITEQKKCINYIECSGFINEQKKCVNYNECSGFINQQKKCVNYNECNGFINETKICIPLNECSGFVNEQRICLPLNECKDFINEQKKCLPLNECNGVINQVKKCIPLNECSGFVNEQKMCLPLNECIGFINEQKKCTPLNECSGFVNEQRICFPLKKCQGILTEQGFCIQLEECKGFINPKTPQLCQKNSCVSTQAGQLPIILTFRRQEIKYRTCIECPLDSPIAIFHDIEQDYLQCSKIPIVDINNNFVYAELIETFMDELIQIYKPQTHKYMDIIWKVSNCFDMPDSLREGCEQRRFMFEGLPNYGVFHAIRRDRTQKLAFVIPPYTPDEYELIVREFIKTRLYVYCTTRTQEENLLIETEYCLTFYTQLMINVITNCKSKSQTDRYLCEKEEIEYKIGEGHSVMTAEGNVNNLCDVLWKPFKRRYEKSIAAPRLVKRQAVVTCMSKQSEKCSFLSNTQNRDQCQKTLTQIQDCLITSLHDYDKVRGEQVGERCLDLVKDSYFETYNNYYFGCQGGSFRLEFTKCRNEYMASQTVQG